MVETSRAPVHAAAKSKRSRRPCAVQASARGACPVPVVPAPPGPFRHLSRSHPPIAVQPVGRARVGRLEAGNGQRQKLSSRLLLLLLLLETCLERRTCALAPSSASAIPTTSERAGRALQYCSRNQLLLAGPPRLHARGETSLPKNWDVSDASESRALCTKMRSPPTGQRIPSRAAPALGV